MNLPDDKIQDYVDGRLSEEEAAIVAASLRIDPVLQRQVEQLQRLNEMLQHMGQTHLHEPVPDRFVRILKRAPPEDLLSGDRPQNDRRAPCKR